jgi:hypothetical protein
MNAPSLKFQQCGILMNIVCVKTGALKNAIETLQESGAAAFLLDIRNNRFLLSKLS